MINKIRYFKIFSLVILVAILVIWSGRANTALFARNSWTARSAAAANWWNSVIWLPELGLFVAVADSGANRVMTSRNGGVLISPVSPAPY